jgi:hypothetical protein
MIESPIGDAIEPTFPEETFIEPEAQPVFDIYFKVGLRQGSREAIGEDQRDDAIEELSNLGATDIVTEKR